MARDISPDAVQQSPGKEKERPRIAAAKNHVVRLFRRLHNIIQIFHTCFSDF